MGDSSEVQRASSKGHGEESLRQKSSNESQTEIETRLVAHKYFLRRPRALQYSYKDENLSLGDELGRLPDGRAPTMFDDGHERAVYDLEGIARHRERIDLFIDLIWVGIIVNMSEVFSRLYYESKSKSGEALGVFLLLFLPAYRIWNILRHFLDSFYMDDMFQRLFVYWMLLLAVFFGNNLIYMSEDVEFERVKEILIIVYLIIRASFMAVEAFYSIWIPWLRKFILVSYLAILPSSALWIGAIFVQGVNAAGLIIPALVWEYAIPVFLESRLGRRLVSSEYRRTSNSDHLRTRMASFFIISLGEGVLLLIKEGPLGIGVNYTTGLACWGLLIYSLLAYLYFNRDQSKRSIPAVKLANWRSVLWMFSHVPLFASLVVLASGFYYIIKKYAGLANTVDAATNALTSGESKETIYRAIWSIAICLAIIIFCIWVQALLDKPMDGKGVLLVGNRHLRMIMRPVYIIIVLCAPIKEDINPYVYMGIASLLLSIVLIYEWVVSMERPTRFLEPKGLTVIMNKSGNAKSRWI